MDRINGLSDEIICHILSFLVIKEAALTSLLSHRWRYLFVFRPSLHFEDLEVGNGQNFMDFVDRVLAVSGNFPLRSFSIKCRKSIDSGHVTGWMTDVLKRGVMSLEIDINNDKDAVLVPLEIFTCKTIVELKLGLGFDAMVPEDVFLPSLKTLFLDWIYFYNSRYCVLGKLLPACPVLEELTIRSRSWQNGNYCRNLSSSTLKKLTINCVEGIDYWDMILDTPSLAYLEISDLVPKEYPMVNLASLVEAKLDLGFSPHISNPTNLINGLRNIEVLELSSVSTSEMLYYIREEIPMFRNLFRLCITTNLNHYHWKYFPILIRKCPNLHTLIIKGPLNTNKFEGENRLSSPVKVLKITEYGGKIGELERMEQFLEQLSCLEFVKVCSCARSDQEKVRITKHLRMLRRSSKCNILIKFSE